MSEWARSHDVTIHHTYLNRNEANEVSDTPVFKANEVSIWPENSEFNQKSAIFTENNTISTWKIVNFPENLRFDSKKLDISRKKFNMLLHLIWKISHLFRSNSFELEPSYASI